MGTLLRPCARPPEPVPVAVSDPAICQPMLVLKPDHLPSTATCFITMPCADIQNPGYFPPILGLFWAISDYLKLNPGYLPPMHRHIVTVSASPALRPGVTIPWGRPTVDQSEPELCLAAQLHGQPQLPAGTQVNSLPLLRSVLLQGVSHITEGGSKGREEAEHSRWAKLGGSRKGD